MPDSSKKKKQKNEARRLLFPNLPKGRLTDSPSVTPEQSRSSGDRGNNRRNSTPTNSYHNRPDVRPRRVLQMTLDDFRAQAQPQERAGASSGVAFPEDGDVDGFLFKMHSPGVEMTARPVENPSSGPAHVRFATDGPTPTSFPQCSPSTWYDSGDEDQKQSPSPAPRLHGHEFDLVKDKFPQIGSVGNQTHHQKVMGQLENDRMTYANQLNTDASCTGGDVLPYALATAPKAKKSHLAVINPNDLILKPGAVSELQPSITDGDLAAVPRGISGSKTRTQVPNKLRRSERTRKRTLDDMRNTNTMAKKDVEREREIREGWMASEHDMVD